MFMKRAFDVALSGSGLLVSAPLWAVFAAAIKLEDGGPVFFRQQRSGRTARSSTVLKFRSMVPDAEAATGAVQASRARPAQSRGSALVAGHGDGRIAAAPQHLPRRHELRRSARAAPGRDRNRLATARSSGWKTFPDSRSAHECSRA